MALDTGIGVLDAAREDIASASGLLVFGPVLASAFVGPGPTAVVSAYAVLLAALVAASEGNLETLGFVVRLVGISTGSLFAVWLAAKREKRAATLQQLRRVAEAAQHAILRPVPATVDGIAIATRYQSASSEAAMGGDFYEVASTPFGVRAVIGDVRGKGVSAIRLAEVVLGSFREAAYGRCGLAAVAKLMDESTSRHADVEGEDYATALLVEFRSDGTVAVANCGHHPPLRAGRGGVHQLDPSSRALPLGLGSSPPVDVFVFEHAERLLCYTDGALEGRDRDGTFFPLAEVCSSIAVRTGPLEEVLEELLGRLGDHVGGDIDDDVALVLVERVSPTPAARTSSAGDIADALAAGAGGPHEHL